MSDKKVWLSIPVLPNVHTEMFTPAEELYRRETYPDVYPSGGIQNGTQMNKLQKFVRNEQPLVGAATPRLNLKSIVFEERFK